MKMTSTHASKIINTPKGTLTMARKSANGVTKSSLIREALAKFPEMGPTEMARNLTVANPGKKFGPAEVSALKTKSKADQKNGTTGKAATTRPATTKTVVGNSVVGYVLNLKEAIVGLGGKEEVKRLVDAL